jgi:hypothetical protein
MNRISTLPGGCKNLSDTVRIHALEGQQQWPLMTLAAAQKLASDQHADLIHIDTDGEPIFALVDEAMWRRLEKLDILQEIAREST